MAASQVFFFTAEPRTVDREVSPPPPSAPSSPLPDSVEIVAGCKGGGSAAVRPRPVGNRWLEPSRATGCDWIRCGAQWKFVHRLFHCAVPLCFHCAVPLIVPLCFHCAVPLCFASTVPSTVPSTAKAAPFLARQRGRCQWRTNHDLRGGGAEGQEGGAGSFVRDVVLLTCAADTSGRGQREMINAVWPAHIPSLWLRHRQGLSYKPRRVVRVVHRLVRVKGRVKGRVHGRKGVKTLLNFAARHPDYSQFSTPAQPKTPHRGRSMVV